VFERDTKGRVVRLLDRRENGSVANKPNIRSPMDQKPGPGFFHPHPFFATAPLFPVVHIKKPVFLFIYTDI
jgi:hypothetical protein